VVTSAHNTSGEQEASPSKRFLRPYSQPIKGGPGPHTCQITRIADTTLKNKVGELPDFGIQYYVAVIKTTWNWQKNAQRKGTEQTATK
jgi:hypothetical protein